MKRICFKAIIASIAASAIFLGMVNIPSLQKDVSADSGTTIEVSDDDASADAAGAIQSALNKAKNKASKEDPYTVILPEGKTYDLNLALKIFSNTTLDLNGSTLIEKPSTQVKSISSFISDSRWMNGTNWNSSQKPKLSNGSTSGARAYCSDFISYCYGAAGVTSGTKFTNINDIRVGDVIVVGSEKDGGHWFVVIGRDVDKLRVAEGDYSSKVRIGWNYTINGSKFAQDSREFLHGWHFQTVSQNDNFNMIHIGSYDSDKDGVTGYDGYENITIKNGTLDGNGCSATILKGAHATNVKIDHLTLKHTVSTHLSEFAAINKLSITNCKFSDMKLSGAKETYYEAIQLDILVPSHFGNYHAEALPVKNVKVSGCTFTNVPRAVGSHTAILNAPMSDITIEDNVIKDCISAGIQFCNWKNVTVKGNTITNCPRGIAVFSVNCNGGESSSANGTYKASFISSAGDTTSSVSDSYKAPGDMNIVISDNVISLNNEDDYSGYFHCGIQINGTDYTEVKTMGDKSGDIPLGKYYVKGITVKHNTVDSTGFGIRCVFAADVTVEGNKVDLSKAKPKSSDPDFYGISASKSASGIKIISNDVAYTPASGIFVNGMATDIDIKDNVVSLAGDAGIKVTEAKTVCNTITGNTIIAAKGNFSIFVSNKGTAKTITDNLINCPKDTKNAVKVDSISKCSTKKNNTVKKFKDVTNTKDFWFVPTYWGAAKGVVKGYNKETEFRPANECTRAQMVTFMWRLEGCPEPSSTKCKFSDVKKTDYFYKAVIWGNENGIVEGYKNGTFGPQIVCARKHAVTFLWRLAGQPEPSSAKNKFKDVKKTDYFFKPTLWASEKGILAGYSDGTFKPNGKCLRRQMVTFLYKYNKFVK